MPIERARATQLAKLSELQASLDAMHKDVSVAVHKNRARQVAAHNKRTNLVEPNFSVGDFVFVRRAQDRGHKLNFRWIGPRRVVGIVSDLVYDVAKLDGSVDGARALRATASLPRQR